MNQDQQAKFEGWAIVEMFGHQKVSGFVTTENYGQAALFRVDVPELPEREKTLRYGQTINGVYVASGGKVKEPAEPAYSRLIGPGAVYALNPCTEQTVREFLDNDRKLPLIPLDLAGARAKALAAPEEAIPVTCEDEDDDSF